MKVSDVPHEGEDRGDVPHHHDPRRPIQGQQQPEVLLPDGKHQQQVQQDVGSGGGAEQPLGAEAADQRLIDNKLVGQHTAEAQGVAQAHGVL